MTSSLRLLAPLHKIRIQAAACILVCVVDCAAQVSIRERIAITPRGKSIRSDFAPTTQTCWVTPDSGLLILMPGIPSRYACNVSFFEMSQPVFRHHCGYIDSPDKWTDTIGHVRKGTEVAMSMVEVSTSIRLDASFLSTEYIAPDSSKLEALFNYPGGYESWYSWIHFERGSDFDHFSIGFSPDTIAYRDTSQLVVMAVDAGNQEVSLSGNTQLTLTLDSSQYGQFISSTGQLVTSPYSAVSYSDARSGVVKFTANGARDTMSLRRLTIRVGGAQKNGSGDLFVGNIRLRFLHKDPRSLWPFIEQPSARKFRSNYSPLRFRDTIQVVHPAGRSMNGKEIFLQTSYLPGTGGHGHAQSLDTVMFDTLQGRFYSQGRNGNPLSRLLTDSDGRVTIDSLRSSPFSGTYFMLARLMADTAVFDSILFNVRADSLVGYPGSQYCVLVGNTGDPGGNHTSNHNGLQYAIDSLDSGILAFYDYTRSSEGGSNAMKLKINDMSLPWGGWFDIAGTWGVKPDTSHNLHRVGLSIDVGTSTNEGVTLKGQSGLTKKGERLVELMFHRKFGDMPEPTIHFEYGYVPRQR